MNLREKINELSHLSHRHLDDEHFIAVGEAGAQKLVPRSKPVSAGEGGGGGGEKVYPAKITGKSGAFYTVAIYANGFDQSSTGSGTAKVLMLNYADTLPTDTEVMVLESQVQETGGGSV